MKIDQLKSYIEETRRWSEDALENGNIERYEFLCRIIDRRSSELYRAELKAYVAAI